MMIRLAVKEPNTLLVGECITITQSCNTRSPSLDIYPISKIGETFRLTEAKGTPAPTRIAPEFLLRIRLKRPA